MPTTAVLRRHRRIAGLAALTAMSAAFAAGSPASAAVNVPGGLNLTTFSVYLQAGEHVVGSFPASPRVVVTRPDGTVAVDCAGPATCAVNETATSDGVWTVAKLSGPDNNAAWAIDTHDAGGVSIPGRVWTESLQLTTNGFRNVSFGLYFLDQAGVRYQAQFTNFMGWSSVIEANNRGVMVADGSCRPAYRSAMFADATFTTNLAGCAATGARSYRIFLDPPAADLPASTDAWADGRTTDRWVAPSYAAPSFTTPTLERDAPAANAGTIRSTLAGQPGNVTVRVDTDDNGAFDDAVDVEIPVGLVAPGPIAVGWDGLDGTGAAVPVDARFSVRMELTGEAELHFTATDVEGLGAMRLTRLNGPGAPDSTMSWDDSVVGVAPFTTYGVVSPLVGDRVDSSGGVHGWQFTPGMGGALGDGKRIDHWASVRDATVEDGVIEPPAIEPATTTTTTAPTTTEPPATSTDQPSTSTGAAPVDQGLAFTGRRTAPFSGLALAFLAAGSALLFGARRRRATGS